jgi:cathepsin A (carboxypeptidase C)
VGLLLELGPCRVVEGGNRTAFHQQSWNTDSNVIFLDQPVGTGFSYSDHGLPTTPTAHEAAKDVYAFLQLFIARFSEYADQPLHVAGESWGGHFVPNIGSVIYHKNKELVAHPDPYLKKINLASLLIGNGMTDPYRQFDPIPEFLCLGPYAIFDPPSPQCKSLREMVPNCKKLTKSCYDYQNPLVCTPAELYCWRMVQPVVGKLLLESLERERRIAKLPILLLSCGIQSVRH